MASKLLISAYRKCVVILYMSGKYTYQALAGVATLLSDVYCVIPLASSGVEIPPSEIEASRALASLVQVFVFWQSMAAVMGLPVLKLSLRSDDFNVTAP
jgi:hypothetical protein